MKQAPASRAAVVVPPLVLLAIVLVLWDAAAALWDVPAYLLPRPLRVWNAAVAHADQLVRATGMTAAGAGAGFIVSLVVGTAIALLFSQSAVIRRSAYPYAIFLQTMPIIAMAPIIITWFGTGFVSVVIVSFILSLFPIITNVTAGLLAVDPNLLELFEIYNASRAQVLGKLRLPNAVPYLITGAKISCGLSVIGAIVGEIYAGYGTSSYGLGYLITGTAGKLETDYLFAAVICSALLGIAIFAAVNLAGAAVLRRWQGSDVPRSTVNS